MDDEGAAVDVVWMARMLFCHLALLGCLLFVLDERTGIFLGIAGVLCAATILLSWKATAGQIAVIWRLGMVFAVAFSTATLAFVAIIADQERLCADDPAGEICERYARPKLQPPNNPYRPTITPAN